MERYCRFAGFSLFFLLVFLLFPFPASAQAGEGKTRGDYLTLKIAVMGPGDELYFWWGHIALVIEDSLSGEGHFYDYGLFSFENDHFFLNFATGRLLYSCGVSLSETNYRVYRRTNRDITLYTLDLPPARREEIRRFAETNVLPENRDYYYHHFRDNCSTRIRDIIDLATGGQFKERFGRAPGRFTLRQHVRRHTWFAPFSDWILNFWMGQDIDTPITVWDEMFLPSEVGERIQGFEYTDDEGLKRPLVSGTEILNRAVNRPRVLDAPRRQWIRELILACFLAAFMAGLSVFRGIRPGLGGTLWGIAQAGFGLFFGLAGTLLVFLSFFTDHDYTYHNINVLFVNPLFFAALVWGIRYAFPGSDRRGLGFLLKCFWTYVFVAGLLTMPLKLLPFFWQQNQVTQALLLPPAFVLSLFPGMLVGLFHVLNNRIQTMRFKKNINHEGAQRHTKT
ncbi:MAG: DUF4105 domain-containing protein [Treponema sp.]|nr:DUF4105 domain-containing protein [Treponema sp.]